MVPASPAPLTPIGLTGVVVTVRSSSYIGNMLAFGIAYSFMDAVISSPLSS